MAFCEVKSLTIYKNCNSNTVYLTVQDYTTKEIFGGKISYEIIPKYLLDNFLIVKKLENSIGTQQYSSRKGIKTIKTEIQLFDIEELLQFKPLGEHNEAIPWKNSG